MSSPIKFHVLPFFSLQSTSHLLFLSSIFLPLVSLLPCPLTNPLYCFLSHPPPPPPPPPSPLSLSISQVENFTKCDPEYGSRLAKALEKYKVSVPL